MFACWFLSSTNLVHRIIEAELEDDSEYLSHELLFFGAARIIPTFQCYKEDKSSTLNLVISFTCDCLVPHFTGPVISGSHWALQPHKIGCHHLFILAIADHHLVTKLAVSLNSRAQIPAGEFYSGKGRNARHGLLNQAGHVKVNARFTGEMVVYKWRVWRCRGHLEWRE